MPAPRPADVLVVFGITGDPARVMTFRSLYRLEGRGLLACPVVGAAIAGKTQPVFYLEIPPSLFGTVVAGLAGAGLTAGARVVVEKPFGHDQASARALAAELHEHQDGVEETWRVMQPLLDAPPPVHRYAPGSWGPIEADAILAGHGRWHTPWEDP